MSHYRHISYLLGSFIGLMLCAQAHALSLGKLRVISALDEPLVAQIELESAATAELDSLQVSLGSSQDFLRAGVQRREFLSEMAFTVDRSGDSPVIRVSTDQPTKEPFLHFLVTAQWSGGRLVREYTALLDPPLYASERPATISSPQQVGEDTAPGDSTTAPSTTAVPAATSQLSESAETIGAGSAESVTGEVGDVSVPGSTEAGEPGVRYAEYGPVAKGDTLWDIATKLETEDPSVDTFQVMFALLRENPNAFVNNNVNRLKVGEILRLADIDAINQISKEEAKLAYTAQLEEWQAYRDSIAQASGAAKIPSALAGASDTATGSQADAAAEITPASSAEATGAGTGEDVLRIVQADLEPDDKQASGGEASAPGGTSNEVNQLRERLSTMEEALASKEIENRELSERVQLLEQQLESVSRLMEVESAELAAAQQQLAEQRAAQSQAATAAPQAASRAPAKTAQQAAPAAKIADTKATEAAKPAKPKPRVQTPPAKPWYENVIDSLFASWMWMAGAGLGLIVLLVGALLFMRRRRSIAEFEESILSGSALEGQTDTTDTGTAATDTSFLSDFGMAGMGNMQADEVDPLAEAEVYLAYGRDEQAEEVLKEAVSRNPQRPELKLKLLEIYEQRKDLKSFETLAEELYPASGQEDPQVWQKVVDMGRKMNPDNPLFDQELPVPVTAATAAAGAALAGAAITDTVAATVDEDTAHEGTEVPVFEQESSPPAADDLVDFALEPRDDELGQEAGADLGVEVSDGELGNPTEGGQEVAAQLVDDSLEDDLSPTTEPAQTDEPSLDFDEPLIEEATALLSRDPLDDTAVRDPELQAFPAPEEHPQLDRELEKLAGDVHSVSDVVEDAAQETVSEITSEMGDSATSDEVVESLQLPDADADRPELVDVDVAELDLDLDLEDGRVDEAQSEEEPELDRPAADLQPAAAAADDSRDDFNLAELDLDLGLDAEVEDDDARVEPAAQDTADQADPLADTLEFEAPDLPDTSSEADESEPMGQPEAFDEVDERDQEQWDEAATKLDLARAYMDMGDEAGARSIIEEVMREGNTAQKNQAAELATQLN